VSSRGQKFTVKWKTPVYYSDFLSAFSRNPTTGALGTVTNEDAINQSIMNLVMTRPGSRPGRNALGSKVLSSLFDLGTPASLDILQSTIENVIQNYEPRAENVVVVVDRSPDVLMGNEINVTVTYQPINLPQTVTFSFPLKRVR
jgi:phage baseplate assembly protein W